MDEGIEKAATSMSPIEGEIKKLFVKTDHLAKQLSRVLAPITEGKPVPPRQGGILSDLEEVNEKLGNILDRLQI